MEALWAAGWLEPICKYRLVCIGFFNMENVMHSLCHRTKTSRKGSIPSCSRSIVDCVTWSMELRWVRKLSPDNFFMMQRYSPACFTNTFSLSIKDHSHISAMCSIVIFAAVIEIAAPIAAPLACPRELPLTLKSVSLRQYSNKQHSLSTYRLLSSCSGVSLPPPDRLVLSKNAADNWKSFKQHVELP